MTISEVKRRTRVEEWGLQIREQQKSGMSIKAWCREHGIRENRYYYWLRIIRSTAIEQAEQRAALIRVEPECLPSTALTQAMSVSKERQGITMTYGKASVEFPVGTPITEIVEVLKALGAT